MDILISNDGSRKYIFKCFDGNLIETVFIPGFLYSYKNALCISSQVGCCMNCSFCATGKMGFRRNLLPSEILNQIYVVLRDLIKIKSCENVFKNHLFNNSRIINNIVYMGMGEPLHNYNNVTKSIELLMHEKGQLYSYRNITVSTSGIVKNINRLWHTKVNLAISLNAADNLTRDSIMPINKKWNIKKLLNACKQYSLSNRKIVTFVYIMISGLNDSDLDAKKLANLLINFKAKINLIPFNTHKFSIFKKPNYNRIIKFQNILLSKKFSVFIRNTRGADINAACGMLYTV
jgi:23S rRNA (adenine2503-C2)-methyltransferase